ncbi:tRNA-specific adenosine deaminase [Kordiimonas sediminis]|uniref:tRNA-specific adenosine deaminase n=1 Tax=Kordiimonas sediminis TaxID=1735581 RepID=A0A919ANE2_9PROT|nr:nucleoside deaminase [Kordiimonas sediminis]GHF17108.1 tRNA-specific adenosine deaminase [Kordiimonas sediminis]
MIDDFPHMRTALDQAEAAARSGEVPVGAVLVGPDGAVLAAAHNLVVTQHDPTAHAEMLVIREGARKLGSERLEGCDLYVTLEPCAMCAQAIAFARIRRVYYGAEDEKGGGVTVGARIFNQKTTHHRPEVIGGILDRQAGKILKDFFASKR